ncbi:hypothetical protein [Variovorax sp. YR216]|uniref:hypothetical protein n=1 Tax=Variovorax sp. YR216 TaxID=1882828 RepID=UPI000898236A|nr:hypothetical protein [Variovorax sp. YR216]SEB14134.1 hypothetical protein SAMN05444680_109109 [Variovorax sp. YR216]
MTFNNPVALIERIESLALDLALRMRQNLSARLAATGHVSDRALKLLEDCNSLVELIRKQADSCRKSEWRASKLVDSCYAMRLLLGLNVGEFGIGEDALSHIDAWILQIACHKLMGSIEP